MKVELLKTDQRVTVFDDLRFKVQRYGLHNDYPQKVREIMQSSGTASLCVNLYAKFIKGGGFLNESLNRIEINKRFKMIQLLNMIAGDLALYSGFAIHCNYNGKLEKIGYSFVPFEFCRLGIDENRNLNNTIGIHSDWGNRKGWAYRLTPSNVKFVDLYTEDPSEIKDQIKRAGGISKWNGHIFWYSPFGLNYPLCSFDSVVSDVSTEDAVATVKNRNAKNNFFPAGMVVTMGKDNEQGSDREEQESEAGQTIKKVQGDSNACKIIHVQVDNLEEAPKFVEFPMKNYDRAFETTEKTIQQNIGNIFNQPAVLRGQLIAGKLATSSEIIDAYTYYNAVTESERMVISEQLYEIFGEEYGDFTIKPLNYAVSQS